jgi:hypothetical protein
LFDISNEERETCRQMVWEITGTSEEVRRAQVLLKADVDGPTLTNQKIAEAFLCRTRTGREIRKRCVLQGFEQTLDRKPSLPYTPTDLLNGRQEANVIALRPAPKGYSD